MVIRAFPKLENSKIVRAIGAFFRLDAYPVLIAFLMACSELFGLELVVFYLYLFFGALGLLFTPDSRALIPCAACGYMTISAINNPGRSDDAVFYKPEFIIQLGLILFLFVVLMVGKLVIALLDGRKKGTPRLLLGFAVLWLGYTLAGVGSPYYAGNTVLFGFVQIVSLFLFYFFFYYTVDWQTVPVRYFAVLLTAMGAGLLLETVGMYFNEGVVLTEEIDRGALYTGWGVYNNVACMVAMCLPGPFYFAVKNRHGWLYCIFGNLYFLSLLLTQSRGGILFGTVVYLACAITVMVRSKRMQRVWNMLVFTAMLFAILLSFFLLFDRVSELFASLIQAGADDANRFEIYEKCWNRFLEYPAFGAGFYRTPGALLYQNGMIVADAPEGAFFPPRAHNTVFQLLATGGAVGLALYLYHRAETLISLFKKPSLEKTMIFYSMMALLLTSLLDCNFFNVGPGIVYGIVLVLAEGIDKKRFGAADPYWLRRKSPSPQKTKTI